MKKLTCVFTLIIVIGVCLIVEAKRYEGEVVQTNIETNILVLQQDNGKEIQLSVSKAAKLYFNNSRADLGMYTPVTEGDFLSGYVETNEEGLVESAFFYYQTREGSIHKVENGRLIIKDIECGIYDEYPLTSDVQVILNNYPASLDQIKSGMRALVILNYKLQVKKIAVFHYDYSGLIQTLDLTKGTVVLNIGSRLNPEFKEFDLGENVGGIVDGWENVLQSLKKNSLLLAKVMVKGEQNMITFMDIRFL